MRATYQGREVTLLKEFTGLSFKTLRILNEQYQQGDFQYGIPHPGMIVINSEGEIVGKLFLEAYSSRIDSAAALTLARATLGVN